MRKLLFSLLVAAATATAWGQYNATAAYAESYRRNVAQPQMQQMQQRTMMMQQQNFEMGMQNIRMSQMLQQQQSQMWAQRRAAVNEAFSELRAAQARGDTKGAERAQAKINQMQMMLNVEQAMTPATGTSSGQGDAQFKQERRNVYERNLQGAHDNRVRLQNDTSGALPPSMLMEAKRLERQMERDARDAGYQIQRVYPK